MVKRSTLTTVTRTFEGSNPSSHPKISKHLDRSKCFFCIHVTNTALFPYPTSAYSRTRNWAPKDSASLRQAWISTPGAVTALATTTGM